jgi:hypothetical protein
MKIKLLKLGERLQLENENGNLIVTVGHDPAPFVGFNFRLFF